MEERGLRREDGRQRRRAAPRGLKKERERGRASDEWKERCRGRR